MHRESVSRSVSSTGMALDGGKNRRLALCVAQTRQGRCAPSQQRRRLDLPGHDPLPAQTWRARQLLKPLHTASETMPRSERQRFSGCPRCSQGQKVVPRMADWYEAFEDGRIDQARLQRVEAGSVPTPTAGQWLWTEAETTGMARHRLVDTPGLLLAVDVPAASVSDPAAARMLLTHPTGTRCVACGLMEPLAHA